MIRGGRGCRRLMWVREYYKGEDKVGYREQEGHILKSETRSYVAMWKWVAGGRSEVKRDISIAKE